jgi:hypothetical protein
LRKLAITFTVLAAAASIAAPAAQAQAGPPDVREIVGEIIICVMAPCP